MLVSSSMLIGGVSRYLKILSDDIFHVLVRAQPTNMPVRCSIVQRSVLGVGVNSLCYYLVLGSRDLCGECCEELLEFAGLVGARKVEDLINRVFVDVRHIERQHVLGSCVYVLLQSVAGACLDRDVT